MSQLKIELISNFFHQRQQVSLMSEQAQNRF